MLLLFAIFATSLCRSQSLDSSPGQIFFKRISTEHGLPQPSVNAILRDSRGFVWMATEDGLSRFDGSEFRTFRHDPSDSTSLSHNVVHFIKEEETTGNLWIGTVSGINYFDRSMERFRVYKTNHPPGTVYSNAALDKKRGRLWLACTVAGLRYLDLVSQTVVDVTDSAFANETVWNVAIDGDSLAVATLQGLKILDLKNQMTSVLYSESPTRSILFDNKELWFGTEGKGLGHYDRATGEIVYYNVENKGTNNNDIWAIAKDVNGSLWLGTDGGGLNVLTRGEKISSYYIHSEFDERSLSYNTVRSIFIENNGNVWIGTYNGGVNYHENTAIEFSLFRKDMFNKNSLSNNVVSAFTEADDGTIWVGTDGGGLHYFKEGGVHRYSMPAKLGSIKVVTSLYADGEGLWVGSFRYGLIYLDGHGGWKQFVHDNNDSTSVAANTIWSIQKDSLGYLWVGTNRGVNRLDPKTGIFNHIDNPLRGNIDKLFKNVQAQTLLIDSNNTLWVGSYGLLMAYLPAYDSVIEIKGIDARGRSLPDLRVKTLLEDDGKIWIGTYGSGLCQYNFRNQTFSILDERDGLPDDIVLSVEKGIDETLWLSTNKGLVHFNEVDTVFTVFDQHYGVQGTTFNRNAALRTFDGRLLFGGTDGFNVFRPRALTDDMKSLQIVFTDFRIFNERVKPGSDFLEQSITETQTLDLAHTDSRLITLSFSALNFLSPDRISYSFLLKGFDDNWQNIGHEHSLTFTNLDPGSYTLTVRASLNGRTWGPEKSITIIIQTPWWKSKYFGWAAFSLFAISGYAFYRYRTYHLDRRKRQLEQLVNLQAQEIRKQNHDLAAQNEELKAQNEETMVQQQMISEQNRLLSEAKRNLQEINQSLEQVVDQRTEKLNETIRQLNKTIKELDAFVYSASHDLIAPLKSVSGLIELTRRQNQNPEVGVYIDHIEQSIEKLEDVISNMIQYSQNSSQEVVYEEVNLFDTISESISDLKFFPGMESMNFIIDVSEEARVMSDRTRLRIILNNLIGNSIKYRDERKEQRNVRITFEKKKTIWKLEIEDNGIGIDKRYLSRVFEMFFRGTDRSQGSGLGLYIVKETVERLYGEVYVDSEIGLWTKFTVAVPYENVYLRKK